MHIHSLGTKKPKRPKHDSQNRTTSPFFVYWGACTKLGKWAVM